MNMELSKPTRKLSKSKAKKPTPSVGESEKENGQGHTENEDPKNVPAEVTDTKKGTTSSDVPQSPAKSATSSPVKKRARLSLKANKSVQRLASFFGPESSPREGNMAPNVQGGSNSSKCDRGDNTALYGKPCVASLHNLGNTCFLNSVLQVFRYTPGFLNMLSNLSKEIERTESLQDFVVAETTNDEDDDEIMTWTLVKCLDEVFKKMKLAEDKYKSKTSHYLAVRPYDMMASIEKINPMFEGNMQHDVHELLRCLLAYMQDAVRELNKFRSTYKERYLGDNPSVTLKNKSKPEGPSGKVKKELEEEECSVEIKQIDADDETEISIKVEAKTEPDELIKEPTPKPRKNRLSTPKNKKEAEIVSASSSRGKKTAEKDVKQVGSPKKTRKDQAKESKKVNNEVDAEDSDTKASTAKNARGRGKNNGVKKEVKSPRSTNRKKETIVENGQNGEKTKRGGRKSATKDAKKETVSTESDKEEAEDDTPQADTAKEKETKIASKPKSKLSRKLTHRAGQKKLNGFLKVTSNDDDDISEYERRSIEEELGVSSSQKCPLDGAVVNGSKVKGPSTPKKKLNLTVHVNNVVGTNTSPHKDSYKTPEKANIALTAMSPVTAKQMHAKHQLMSEDPASADTPTVIEDIKNGEGVTEDSSYQAALHSPTQIVNGHSSNSDLMANGVDGSHAAEKAAVKKSQRGRVVKVTPKAAALVIKASKKRKLSGEDSKSSDSDSATGSTKASVKSTATSKARSKSRKSTEHINGSVTTTLKVNGKENAKVINGKAVDSKQMNVLAMLTNPVPRKRLGVRGSLVRKPSKDDINASDTSLNLSDQVDGCNDDPYIKDREPFEDNPPDGVQEILNSGAQGTYLPAYFSSDDSDMEDVETEVENPGELVNFEEWLTPATDDSFDDYVTDSSASENEEYYSSSFSLDSDTESDDKTDKLSDKTDKPDTNQANPTLPGVNSPHLQGSKDNAKDSSIMPIALTISHPTKDNDKRPISESPESTSSSHSLKALRKKLRTSAEEFDPNLASDESDIEAEDMIPQLDGVFDAWKIPRAKQTARKSCPPDRSAIPISTQNDHQESTDANDIREAVANANQAFVKLSTSEVPSYLLQQVLSTLQGHVTNQDNVSDTVKTTFEGDMALRTRCLECENFTERKEAYQDISLAVKKVGCHDDSDDEGEDGSEGTSGSKDELAWLHSALADVECLDGDNKYLCEKCTHLTEAQRSMHYVTLPRILTLHLKRFAATNGFFGGLTKINDHVPTPLELPCIQDKCQKNCSDPTHRYSLYGVITHTGISIGSGHYIAYVKTTNRDLWRDADLIPDELLSESNNGNNGNNEAENGNGNMPMQTDEGLADPNNNADTNNNLDANDIMPNQNTISNQESNMDTSNSCANSSSDTTRWLECDDDTIRVLTTSEFEDILSNSGAGTPYMLFYHTILDQFENLRV